MALITTFSTTPMVLALYPSSYQVKLEAWKRGEIDWDGNRLNDDEKTEDGSGSSTKATKTEVSRLLVHLRLDTLPGVLGLVAMFTRPNSDLPENIHPSRKTEQTSDTAPVLRPKPLHVHGIRLKELTERESSVMAVTELEEYSQHDHVLNTFRTFGQCTNVAVRGQVLLCPPETYATAMNESASTAVSDLMLLSWSASGSMSENQILPAETVQQRFDNSTFSHFLNKTLSRSAPCNTAVFVDNGFGSRRDPNADPASRRQSVRNLRDLEVNATMMSSSPPIDQSHHIFFPFFGTDDDRVGLHLVLQLAQNPTVTATIILFELSDADAITETDAADPAADPTNPSKQATATTSAIQQTNNPALTTFHTLRDSLPAPLANRVVFETISLSSTSTSTSESAAASILTKAQSEIGRSAKNAGDLVVLGRNLSLNSILSKGRKGTEAWNESEAGKVLGGLAGWMINGAGGPGESTSDGRPSTARTTSGGKKSLSVGGSLVVVRAGN